MKPARAAVAWSDALGLEQLTMRGSRPRCLWGVVASLVTLMGCKSNEYGVTVWNKTGKDLDSAIVQMGDSKLDVGFVVVAGKKSYGLVTMPFPDEAIVAWKAAGGEEHSLTLPVRRWILRGRRFDGQLFFVINPDDTVTFIPVRDINESPLLRSLSTASSGRGFEPKVPI